jgi:hypothetical protein
MFAQVPRRCPSSPTTLSEVTGNNRVGDRCACACRWHQNYTCVSEQAGGNRRQQAFYAAYSSGRSAVLAVSRMQWRRAHVPTPYLGLGQASLPWKFEEDSSSCTWLYEAGRLTASTGDHNVKEYATGVVFARGARGTLTSAEHQFSRTHFTATSETQECAFERLPSLSQRDLSASPGP